MCIKAAFYRDISLPKQFLGSQRYMPFHIKDLQKHIRHPHKPESMQNGKSPAKICQNIIFLWTQQPQTNTKYQNDTSANKLQDICLSHRRRFPFYTIWNDLCVVVYHFQFIHIFSLSQSTHISPFIILSQRPFISNKNGMNFFMPFCFIILRPVSVQT